MKQETDFIRDGFEDCKTADSTRSKLADAAFNLRILQKLKKMKISDFLIHTRMPQYFGNYFNKGKSCALGCLMVKSGAMEPDGWRKSPDWHQFYEFFNCTEEELQRSVWCPVRGCYHHNCVIALIPHLNDTHRRTNTEIGYWLQGHGL